jgi:ferrous iron transport protein B
MTCHIDSSEIDAGAPVILVGNPNVGKSVIFGALTGRYAEVSNYPGTTVEIAAGKIGDITVIDTPGIQSLSALSDDERVTRNILLDRPARAVVQVASASNLRRALLLTVQIAELGCPFVLDLNMADEAHSRGIRIDTARLAQSLGAQVVETVATRRQGLEQLGACLSAASPMGYRIHYDGVIEQAINEISVLLSADLTGKRAIALMMLGGDADMIARYGAQRLAAIQTIGARVAMCYDQPLSYVINRQRLRCVDCLLGEVAQSKQLAMGGFAGWFGRMAVHPVWGWPILSLVLIGMYLFVGQLGAGVLVGWLENVVFGRWITPFATWLIGLLHVPFLFDLLVGPYGLVSMALSYGFAIVMPIVLTFFLAFSFLEDSGYLPRLAAMMDRPFKAMGLNGRAVLPMVLGLGCDTMATLTTRILKTRRDRILVTLLLALGVPCSAQLGVMLGMIAFLSPAAIVVWIGVVVSVLFVVGWLAAKIIPGERSDFILELPPIRAPQFMNILIKTISRLEWYLKEVLPMFLLGTLILFALDRTGALTVLERLARPLIQDGLGLPAETTGAFIIGFLRRDYGAAGLFNLARSGLLSPVQLVISLVVITLFVPCVANVLIIVKEHGLKTAGAVVGFVFPFAFGVGIVLNQVFRILGVTF